MMAGRDRGANLADRVILSGLNYEFISMDWVEKHLGDDNYF